MQYLNSRVDYWGLCWLLSDWTVEAERQAFHRSNYQNNAKGALEHERDLQFVLRKDLFNLKSFNQSKSLLET